MIEFKYFKIESLTISITHVVCWVDIIRNSISNFQILAILYGVVDYKHDLTDIILIIWIQRHEVDQTVFIYYVCNDLC